MKITKEGIMNSSISLGALIVVIPAFLWFNNTVAKKEEVKEVKEEVKEIQKEDQEYKLKQLEIDVRQTMMIDRLDEQLKGE